MNISFLLGSGISKPILNTDVGKITSSIVDDYWCLHNNLYCKVDTIENESPIVNRFKSVINIVTEELVTSSENLTKENINYEHLFYVFDQIKNIREEARTNHLAHKHIAELEKKCSEYIVNDYGDTIEFIDFARRISTYINSVVFNHLIYGNELDNFIPLFDQFKKEGIKSHIFTLNHDLLLEKYFHTKGIIYNDFFENGDSPLRKFSINSVGILNDYDFCLFKLHGSINWIRNLRKFFDYFVIDEYSSKLLEQFPFLSNGISTVNSTPEFLTGHTNKSIDYFHGIYSFLVAKFIEKLNETDILIVSGFGWQDYVIREIIIEWLDYKKTRKMILCYENNDDPSYFLGPRINLPQVINLEQWLNEVNLDKIKEHL